MAEHSNADVEGMRDYFEWRVQEVAASHGKQVVFWEEVFDKGYRLRNDSVVNIWLGAENLPAAVKAGRRVVFSWGWYLDEQHPDSQRYLESPTNPKGDLNFWEDTWKDFYLNDPMKAIAAQNATLTSEEAALIVGGEASQWGEQAAHWHLDSRIWPRAAAAAERLWSAADVNDTNAAEQRLADFACRLVQRGVGASAIRPSQQYGYCRLPANSSFLREPQW